MKKPYLFPILLIFCAGCSLVSSPNGTVCQYNGLSYGRGDSFPAEDGCNTCYCGNEGEISCTEMACLNEDGNPANCRTDQDCEELDIDNSFCSEGYWSCMQGQCEFTCDISDLLSDL